VLGRLLALAARMGRPVLGVVVGMLVIADADGRGLIGHRRLGGAGFLDLAQVHQRGMLALHAELVPEGDPVRLVEGADRDRHVWTADRAVVERGSAIGAEAAGGGPSS